MTHEELSDLFADTYTVMKKDAMINNKVNIKEMDGIEIIEFEFENNNVTLNRGIESLSVACNEDIIFDIPILDEPQKSVEIDGKGLEFLKRLNELNLELKNSLNIKSYLTDKDTLNKAITVNKRKTQRI
tara:strand:- start:20829 stop:21215 length:387 start_codon:yes stop_codon:yes gene_type:complete